MSGVKVAFSSISCHSLSLMKMLFMVKTHVLDEFLTAECVPVLAWMEDEGWLLPPEFTDMMLSL